MKLSNASNHIVTTIFGILFWIVGLFLTVIDVFKDSYEIDWKILLILGTVGLGLILAPDDLWGLIKSKAEETKINP